MIKIEKLTKIYSSRHGHKCLALDEVSFNLPESGMVFVVGKSGSGKSTFLNLLGGLDEVTQGDIIVDGARFSEFSEKDYDDYRNSYVGFVFQDFCLIDGLTVYENIKLSLDLLGNENLDEISEVLKAVDLEGYENRFPKELSGGQKQRVALARALIKKPKLILADEPTGNLDSKTSKQIIEYLKKLSEATLVVIVSHNLDDANNYADRIIELSDGKIISDTSRISRDEYPLISDGIINIPYKTRLSGEELDKINDAVKTGDYKINQLTDDFALTVQPVDKGDKTYKTSDKSLSLKNNVKLSATFSKGQKAHGIFTALMVSLLIVLLSICQMFSMFDGETLIRENVIKNNTVSFSLYKGFTEDYEYATLETDTLVEITKDDISSFYEKGYTGNVYKLYNYSLALKGDTLATFEHGDQVDFRLFRNLYADFGGGVLECSKEFLIKNYGNNGALEVLSGSVAPEFDPTGIVITDYFADSILNYLSATLKTYDDIVNTQKVGLNGSYFNVKAIINTRYKERHAAFFDKYNSLSQISEGEDKYNAIYEIYTSEEYLSFYHEVLDYLAIGYYIDGDFEQNVLNNALKMQNTYFDKPKYIVDGKIVDNKTQWQYSFKDKLNDGEMILSLGVYNYIFETNYTKDNISEIELDNMTIIDYSYGQEQKSPIFSKSFTITEFSAETSGVIYVDKATFIKLYETHLYPHAIYFDNPESIANIFSVSEETDFFSRNENYKSIYSIMEVLNVFGDFFLLISIGIALITGLVIISFARRIVKRKMYEIGVIRALGGKNKNITVIFILQLIIVSVAIILISTFGLLFLDEVLNTLLVDNLSLILDTFPINNLTIIGFNPLTVFLDIATVFVLSILSALIILLLCRKVKPMDIIRSKE